MRTILPRFRQQLARGMLGWVRKYLSLSVFIHRAIINAWVSPLDGDLS
jgi:hypothetical protein